VRAVEAGMFGRADDRRRHRGNPCQLCRRRAQREVQRLHDTALFDTAQVGDLLIEQLGIRDDHLFARQCADARCLEPDRLDGAGRRAEMDRIAGLERPVEQDRQCREQVGEDTLCRETDGDPADAKSRHQRGNIDA